MAFHLLTSDWHPRDRREAWCDAISRSCSPFNIDFGPPANAFHGEIEVRNLTGLDCARITHNTVSARRSRREVELTDPKVYYLILQVVGTSRLSQSGEEAVLHPGEMTLIDSGRPCAYAFAGNNVCLNLHIPRTLLDTQRGYRRLPLAAPIRGAAAAITGNLMRTAFESAAECSAHQQAGVRDALLTLVSAVLFGDDGDARSDRSMISTVQEFILRHLTDAALSPRMIADAHGISVRHLHRLFESTDETVGNWIRHARLAQCASDLRDGTLKGVSVTEICYRWGFNDSAHFSRAFKAEFGQAPRSYRTANVPYGHDRVRPETAA